MVWSEGNMSLKNPVTPPGIGPGTVRLVAQRLNHYATPDPQGNVIETELTNAQTSQRGRKQNQASVLARVYQDVTNCDLR